MFDTATTRSIRKQPRNAPDVHPWIWPLPKIEGRRPTLQIRTSGMHPYAEIKYDGSDPDERFVPVLAAHDGVITFAGKVTTTRGGKDVVRYSMCLDHADGWSTRYDDLEHMFSLAVDRYARRRKQRVRAGDVLGYASRSPLVLPFELWRCGEESYGPVDPSEYMHSWIVLPWNAQPATNQLTHHVTA